MEHVELRFGDVTRQRPSLSEDGGMVGWFRVRAVLTLPIIRAAGVADSAGGG